MTTTTQSRRPAKRDFAETQWSLVRAAADESCPKAAAALATLCERYWPPIFVYVWRRGLSREDAKDLTQAFFEEILRKKTFANANEAKGKFRAYLMGALHNFMANDWHKARARKRGSEETILSLEEAAARYCEVADPGLTPEKAFDYHWWLILLDEGLKRLEEKYKARGKERLFLVIKPYLTAEFDATARERVARELETSLNAAEALVYRIRQQYAACVRAELAHTVTDEEELKQELHDLFDK